jgi:flagellar hook assembly protein FlgD
MSGAEQGELVESGGGADDMLGYSVATSGDGKTVVAGAPADCPTCHGTGSAAVFTEPTATGGWDQGATHIFQAAVLTPNGGDMKAEDGYSVAVNNNGDTVAVGDPLQSTITAGSGGEVYVYVRPSSGWGDASQNATLEVASGTTNAELGDSVVVLPTGAAVLAGAAALEGTDLPAGAVYAFVRPSGGWPSAAGSTVVNESDEVAAADGTGGDGFGASLGASGAEFAVGAPYHSPDGAAYVDGAPPTVSVATPASGANYAHGASVDASYSCDGDGAAVSSCSGPVASGSPIDTTTAGAHSFTVTATTAAGVQASDTVDYTVSASGTTTTTGSGGTRTPVLTRVRQSHTRWREGAALATLTAARAGSVRPAPVGTTFSFALSEAATVTLRFTRTLIGRDVSHRCVAVTARNRRDRSCRRTQAAGALTYHVTAGATRVRFDGRLSRRSRLAPGTYKVAVTAVNARRQPSATRSLTFTIVAAP